MNTIYISILHNTTLGSCQLFEPLI